MVTRRIALFGGTFDPIHLGHTTVAAAAADHIGAEKVLFIPTKRSPLKQSLPEAGDDDRLTMIALTIDANPKFEVSDHELKKAEPSYTLETVRQFQARYGNDFAIYCLIGADSVEDLPYWHRIADLIDECNLCTMYRAGCPVPDYTRFTTVWGLPRVQKLQQNIIETPLVDISSTQIRNRLAAGQDVTDMVAPAVAEYIRQHNLYKSKKKS
jgi:nicotinate-nucleotide adenylyltransferase